MTNEKPLYLYSTIITNLLTNCIIFALHSFDKFTDTCVFNFNYIGISSNWTILFVFYLCGSRKCHINKTILQNNYHCSRLHEIFGSQPEACFAFYVKLQQRQVYLFWWHISNNVYTFVVKIDQLHLF